MQNNPPTHQIYSVFQGAYDHFNKTLFASQLPACLLTFQRQPKMMGYASHKRWIGADNRFVDELAINPEYFIGGTILEVFQTLVHEMCHIWQYHCGKPSRRKYHNAEWANKMEAIGLMPSSTGTPGGKRTGEHVADYVLAGGRFVAEATSLLEQGFHIPWIDCKGVHYAPDNRIYTQQGHPIQIQPGMIKLIEVIGGNLPHPNNSQSFQVEGVATDLTGGGHNELRIVSVAKKPTRTKYQCRSCLSAIWGKPRLSVICGNCEELFIEVI